LEVNAGFPLYLNIRRLQTGPGKLIMGFWKVLDFLSSKRVKALKNGGFLCIFIVKKNELLWSETGCGGLVNPSWVWRRNTHRGSWKFSRGPLRQLTP